MHVRGAGKQREAGDVSGGGRWVLNKKLQISCTWSLEKLKERLVRMRKLMYQVKQGVC